MENAIMNSNYRYRVGGALTWSDPTYVTRQADEDLYSTVQQGRFCQVLSPRQIGKSSLRLRTSHRLQQAGYRCVSVQATQLTGDEYGMQSHGQRDTPWDKPLIALIWQALGLTQADQLFLETVPKAIPAAVTDEAAIRAAGKPADSAAVNCEADKSRAAVVEALSVWLNATAHLSCAQRLEKFAKVLLLGLSDAAPVVVFIDEIDYLLAFPVVARALFKWIETCQLASQRLQQQAAPPITTPPSTASTVPPPAALTFVVLGKLLPADLEACLPPALSAFQDASSTLITLAPFECVQTQPLCEGFMQIVDQPRAVLDFILDWTGGQPFLTQKLCRTVYDFLSGLDEVPTEPLKLSPKALKVWIAQMVRSEIVEDWRQKDDPIHLRAIYDDIVRSPNAEALITLCQQIASQLVVTADGSALQAELMMSGLVTAVSNPQQAEEQAKRQARKQLQINNEIYRQTFPFLQESPSATPGKVCSVLH